jgi:hypothetical protein
LETPTAFNLPWSLICLGMDSSQGAQGDGPFFLNRFLFHFLPLPREKEEEEQD